MVNPYSGRHSRWFPHFRPVFSDDDINIATYGVPFSVALAVCVLFVHRFVSCLFIRFVCDAMSSFCDKIPPIAKFLNGYLVGFLSRTIHILEFMAFLGSCFSLYMGREGNMVQD